MNKILASVFVLGMAASVAGCNSLPGASCAFDKGEVTAKATGDVRAFLDSALELKKTSDALEADWNAEIKALSVELKTDPTEEAVLAKISINVKELKAKGSCEVMFEANASAGASGAAGGSAGSGGSSGGAGGSAYAAVEVKFEAKCKAEASVKGNLDVTLPAVKAHFPKLLGIAYRYKDLAGKFKATADAGEKMMGSISDPMLLPDVKCAVAALTNVHVEARVSFSVKASASAKGEASSG